jgi:DNA-binding MarR family transcriptional regulator
MKIANMDYSENAERIPGFLLWQVSKLWQRRLNASLKDLGISGTQAVILGNIVRFDGQGEKATQILLSRLTKVDPMTVSQALRTLEKKKLVRRIVPKEDRRAFYVLPTAKGVNVTAQALERFIEAHLEFFGPISDSVDAFAKILQTLVGSQLESELSELGDQGGQT